MKKKKIQKEKKKCLDNLYRSKDDGEKLKWQNVYFWWIRNEDRLLNNQL